MAAPVLELNWGTVRSCPLPDLFEVAAGTGFGLITASADVYRAAIAAGTTDAELQARIADTGVRIGYLDNPVLGLPGVPDKPGSFAKSLDEAVRVSHALGVPMWNVTHYRGSGVGLTELADAMGVVAARAKAEGVRMVVEFLPGTGLPDLATGLQLIEQVGNDCGLLFDTWHHWRSGGRMADLVDLGPEQIGAIQLSDLPADRVDTFLAADPDAAERNARLYVPMTGRLLPGDGVLPWAELAEWMRTKLADVPVGAEIFNVDLDAMSPVDAARATRDALVRVLG